jgi:GT2 family glycosyltransferase
MIPVNAKPDHVPDYISGACLLVKRKTIEDIGLLDDGFFFFFEDADYSLRAKQARWRLSVAGNLLIEHLGSATVRHQTELQARAYRHGYMQLLHKHTKCPGVMGLPPFLFRLFCDMMRLRIKSVKENVSAYFNYFKLTKRSKI